MSRTVRAVSLLVAGLGLAAPPLQAQSGYYLQLSFDLGGDSVVAVAEGQTFDLVLINYDPRGYGLDSFALRVPFDASKLDFVGATKLCPDLAAPLNTVLGSGYVDLSTASCNGYYYFQQIARLTFRLKAGVTNGTMIGFSADTLIDNGALDRTADFRGDLAEVCHASAVWGDVDGNLAVNSRDALVALSSAVGLPTPGFDLSRGDVDEDGAVTSRDAMAMLLVSIGLPAYGFRAGKGMADRCAPQALLPRPLYFDRYGGTAGQAGVSGLSIRAADDSGVTIVGDSADAPLASQWRPRVSPDGNSVLFVCWNNLSYPNVCRADADGSNVVRLTTGSFYEASPDWSPDGTQIVFVRSNQIYTMNANGSGQALIPSSPSGVTSVAWHPVALSRRVAYTIGSSGVNAGIHRRSLDTATTDSIVVGAPTTTRYDVRWVDWSPAGDSLVFDAFVNGIRSVMVAPNAIGATPRVRVSLRFLQAAQPAWTDQGMFFVSPFRVTPDRLFLLRSDGTFARVGRDTQANYAPGMRRTP